MSTDMPTQEMKEHPAVDARRQTPHPLTLTRLTESHPVDGDMPVFRLYTNKRKRFLSGLTRTVCHKQNGPARRVCKTNQSNKTEHVFSIKGNK